MPPLRQLLAHIPEAATMETWLQGAKRRLLSDGDLLAECKKTFEFLYDAHDETVSHA